jgi:hypothetical protein
MALLLNAPNAFENLSMWVCVIWGGDSEEVEGYKVFHSIWRIRPVVCITLPSLPPRQALRDETHNPLKAPCCPTKQAAAAPDWGSWGGVGVIWGVWV